MNTLSLSVLGIALALLVILLSVLLHRAVSQRDAARAQVDALTHRLSVLRTQLDTAMRGQMSAQGSSRGVGARISSSLGLRKPPARTRAEERDAERGVDVTDMLDSPAAVMPSYYPGLHTEEPASSRDTADSSSHYGGGYSGGHSSSWGGSDHSSSSGGHSSSYDGGGSSSSSSSSSSDSGSSGGGGGGE